MKNPFALVLILTGYLFSGFEIDSSSQDYFIKLENTAEIELYLGENLSTWSSNKPLNQELFSLGTSKIKKAFKLKVESLAHIYVITLQANEEDALAALQDIAGVNYIELVPLYATFLTPNDVNALQWNLAKIDAFNAFDIAADGSSITIAVVDDAVQITHPDLAGNIWQNPNETLNGIDDDGNGYIDDISGYDVADNDNDPNPPANASASHFSHGTHCAGIASAVTNNNLGIAAIAMNAKIIAVKCKPSSSSGGSLPAAYEGLEYAISTPSDVISMSWGGGSYSATYQLMMDVAHSQGKILVAAAGNSNISAPMYPASYNHVISVAASDQNDKKASFSNYGSSVDVSAPGVIIYSTVPGTAGYDNKSGTSMACPLVAGLAALMKADAPSLTPDALEICLKQSCDNIDAQNPTFTGQLGAGRINAYKALACLSKEPTANFIGPNQACPNTAVTFTDASVGKGSNTYIWTFTGGSPATSTLASPMVTYTTTGSYAVSLTTTNAYGSDTKTKNDFIKVERPAAQIAGDYEIPSSVKAGITVEFTGTPPFDFVITDGVNDYSYSDIEFSPYFIDFGPFASSTQLSIKSFNDANCSGTKSGRSNISIIDDTCISVIFNGDFKLIDQANCNPIGFKTDMILDCTQPGGGVNYLYITPNGSGWNGGYWSGVLDHTPGGGTNVLIGDGPSSTSRLWYQDVYVEKGKTYDFSAWFVNANVNGRYSGATSSFQIRVKGITGPLLLSTGALGKTTPWTEYVGEYTATETGTIEIDILIVGGPGGGNDFAIDDVSFKCSENTTSCFISSNLEKETCANEDRALSVGTGSGYTWYPAYEISATNTQSVIVTPSSSRYYVCHYKNDTGCTVIDSFDVSANPLPNVVASPQNIELCLGDSIEISASGAPQYTWSPDYRISATTGDKIMCSSDIDQEYILQGTSTAGCIASDTVLLTVESCCFSKAEIQLATNPVICSGESVQFQNNSKSTGTYTYEWLFGANAQPSSFNGENPPLVQFEEGGSYPVQLILTDDCGKDTSIVTIHCIELSAEAGNDTALCLDDEYKLGTTGISDYEYIWEPCIGLSDCADPSPTATMADAITYTVTVKDPFSGCEVSDTVSLKERLRVDRVELIDTKLCDGDTFSIQFDLNHNQSILWHNGSTQSYFETRTDERIWLEVSNGTCGFSDSADILFINCGCVAYVPSAFTPNNDALNDGLIPNLDCLVRDYHFTVFSRWGEKLFETFDPTERWDGTYLGNDVQIGSYIWTLDYINIELEISNRESHKGTVTVIR